MGKAIFVMSGKFNTGMIVPLTHKNIACAILFYTEN